MECGEPDPIDPMAEIGSVQISVQDLLFAMGLLYGERETYF
jgi:hypothetical protein